MINEKELTVIAVIADLGSIQKAAIRLERDPSSLSRMIKRVESELEIVLFRRTPKGLDLTPEGAVYVSAAKKILHLYGQLRG